MEEMLVLTGDCFFPPRERRWRKEEIAVCSLLLDEDLPVVEGIEVEGTRLDSFAGFSLVEIPGTGGPSAAGDMLAMLQPSLQAMKMSEDDLENLKKHDDHTDKIP